MAALLPSVGQASTIGLMSTSIIPPPMAYSTTAIISPVIGGRIPGRIAMPDKPNTASTCAATMLTR